MSTKQQMLGREETDIAPEEVIESASAIMKDRWVSILVQLTNSHRFNKFLEDNFVIQDIIDDDTKTIETRVIEKPLSVGPPLTSSQIHAIRKIVKLHGVEDVDAAYNAIMGALGQDDQPSIVLADSLDDLDA